MHSMFTVLKPVFKHEMRRQMSVYVETQQTVIQFTPVADFSFGFTEGQFLLLNGQKHLRSVAEDLRSNKQKELNELSKTAKARTLQRSQANFSQRVITLSDFYSTCENKYHVMKTSFV